MFEEKKRYYAPLSNINNSLEYFKAECQLYIYCVDSIVDMI